MTERVNRPGYAAVSMDGLTAWVIGGSSGLGRATAVSLAELGAAVTISSRDRAKLEETATIIRDVGAVPPRVTPVDISDSTELDGAIAAWDEPPDVLVLSGGGPPPSGSAFEMAAFDAAYRLLLRPAAVLVSAFGSTMADRGSGVLGFITSSGVAEPIPGLLTSNVFRSGVTALAKSAARELGPRGVRVLCFAPGRIATDRVEALDAARAAASNRTREEVEDESIAAIPLGRYGTPAEFGHVVALLSSPAGSYVSGVTITIDGGKSRGLLT